MRQKDSSQSSLNYWGSSSSNNRQVLLFWLSGHTKISTPGLKLLSHHLKAHGHKGLEKDIPVSSLHLPKIYHSRIILGQG